MSFVLRYTTRQNPGRQMSGSGLSSRARRAAHSAAANIAEGCAKKGSAELRRYLNISLGSLSELSYTLLLARDLQILPEEELG